MRIRLRLLSLLLVALPSSTWAAPDTTLTIDPSATSGATITAADENDRSNDVVTWANAHDHNDIDQTGNTLSLGDGTAGTKSLCANAADSTDLCLRWDDTANVWTIESNASTADDMVVRSTGTGGLIAGTVLYGDGLGPVRSGSNAGTDDQALIADSATASTWRTVPNCTDSGGNHLNYTQSSNSFSCGTSSSSTEVGGTNAAVVHRTAGNVTTTSATLADVTGASITITTGANPILVGFAGTYTIDDATGTYELQVDIDGSPQLGTTGLRWHSSVVSEAEDCSFTMMTTDLTAASHTIKLQHSRGTAGTASLVCGTGTPCNFWVAEVVD